MLIIEIGYSQRCFSLSLTLVSLQKNMPTQRWHMWQMSMKNQLLSTAFATLPLKIPPGRHVHMLFSQSIWLLHNIFARQPRVLPLLLILIYTPLYLKWKKGAVKLRANDPREKQISRLSSRSAKLTPGLVFRTKSEKSNLNLRFNRCNKKSI